MKPYQKHFSPKSGAELHEFLRVFLFRPLQPPRFKKSPEPTEKDDAD
jgi:hypothetical protein